MSWEDKVSFLLNALSDDLTPIYFLLVVWINFLISFISVFDEKNRWIMTIGNADMLLAFWGTNYLLYYAHRTDLFVYTDSAFFVIYLIAACKSQRLFIKFIAGLMGVNPVWDILNITDRLSYSVMMEWENLALEVILAISIVVSVWQAIEYIRYMRQTRRRRYVVIQAV